MKGCRDEKDKSTSTVGTGMLPEPSTGTWDCQGTLNLDNNVPEIVGAIQDERKASFLIMSAHIQSGEKPCSPRLEGVSE